MFVPASNGSATVMSGWCSFSADSSELRVDRYNTLLRSIRTRKGVNCGTGKLNGTHPDDTPPRTSGRGAPHGVRMMTTATDTRSPELGRRSGSLLSDKRVTTVGGVGARQEALRAALEYQQADPAA
jgi:hypothetical protein